MSLLLHTERLYLRLPELADSDRLTDLLDHEVVINLAVVPADYKAQDAMVWINTCRTNFADKTGFNLLVCKPETGVIGTVGVRHEGSGRWTLGYWLGAAFWGNGYATEAAAALLNWLADSHQVAAITANHFLDNPASGRVLEKLGLRPNGQVKQSSVARGGDHPAMSYVLEPDRA